VARTTGVAAVDDKVTEQLAVVPIVPVIAVEVIA
jgi:hypothetical protein